MRQKLCPHPHYVHSFRIQTHHLQLAAGQPVYVSHPLHVSCVPGLPSKLSSTEELCTLLAVAIFTSTAQHAATNNGQVLNTHT